MNNKKKTTQTENHRSPSLVPPVFPPGSLLLSLVQATQNSQPQPDPVFPVVN